MLIPVPLQFSKPLLLIGLMLWLCTGMVYGQEAGRSQAELWATYHESDNDSIQIEALSALASSYTKTNLDSALLLAEVALERAQTEGFRSLEGNAYVSLGEVYDVAGQIEPALENINEGLNISLELKDNQESARAYNSRGLARFYANLDLELARKDFLQAKFLAERVDDLVLLAKVYHNLGRTHQRLRELPKALKSYLRARNLKDSLVAIEYPGISSSDQISTYNNLSVFYQSVLQYDKARETTLQALDIIPEEETGRRAVLLLNLGIIEHEDSNYTDALTYLDESLSLAKNGNFVRYQPNIYNAIGNAHLELKSHEAANDNYELALAILKDVNLPDVKAGVVADQAEMHLRQENYIDARAKATEALAIIQNSENVGKDKFLQSHKVLAEVAEALEDFPAAAYHLRHYADTQRELLNDEHSQEYIGLQATSDVDLNTSRYELRLKDQALAISQKWIFWLQIAVGIAALLALAFAIAKRRETKAKQEVEEKKGELEQLTIKQVDTNQKLTLANNKIQQFAFATGHDLKESLRNITSFTQLASIEMAEDTQQAQQHLKEATTSGKRMRKMLDDLLHYSNIGGNDTSITKMALDEVIGSVKQQLKTEIQECLGDVHLVTPATLKANRTEVEQVFFNLVHNALRYAAPDTPPRIRIEVIKVGEELAFKVKDNGIGIPEEHRQDIFKPFFRLHNRMTSGSGLGLSICQNIVENYEGRVWHEPVAEGGSCFYFTLPTAEVKAQISTPTV
ncbi:MAG: tetratricopeptide repeat-containing sensor histidine kinase [Bacteroidota bacterium]